MIRLEESYFIIVFDLKLKGKYLFRYMYDATKINKTLDLINKIILNFVRNVYLFP